MVVDFEKVLELCSKYQAAWFRGVSARVRAAGVHGEDIQDDGLFKKLLKDGELSNVQIPWQMEDAEYRVMITGNCGVVLIQDFSTNLGLELKVVMDVHERLLSKVWYEKKSRKKDEDIPIEP